MSMQSFANKAGTAIVPAMIAAIAEQRQHLSDIDGLIGDGDHGINMDKGFQMCQPRLDPAGQDMSASFRLLGEVLMDQIGGSMGPLYGVIFRSMARASKDAERIDAATFLKMLQLAEAKVREIGQCEEGDKTLLDVLAPARLAFEQQLGRGGDFSAALDAMASAAAAGREATVGMVARKGRSSRLGERSRGVPDAGATSCCLLLSTMAREIQALLREESAPRAGETLCNTPENGRIKLETRGDQS